ncbi:MAG: hypothetical protein A2X78_00970 [Gammaproteobacteria bacterium GWE2_37_16]|nr:MAG: hypothetical protein A2X78_00970 [Gammaproteobacteria bacterium GWE2_37_16]
MFIKIQNLRIHYKIFGAGESLIFLPGWGWGFEGYLKVIMHLAQNFRVIALDLPGFGLSTPPQTAWQTEQYAALVAEFARELEIINPIMVGHSLGGKIALYLTAENLVATKKLVLISSAGIKLPKKITQYGKMYAFKLLKNLACLPLLKIFLARKVNAYRNKVGSQDYRRAQGVMREILVRVVNEDFRSLLPKIKVPTLLIWGEKDTSSPLTAGQLMKKIIPEAKLVVFPKAGHFPHEHDCIEFCKQVDEFLS